MPIAEHLHHCISKLEHTRPDLQSEQAMDTGQPTAVGRMAPLSRSTRPSGGGVMVETGGMGIILILSSVSAPSRVPQVV